MQPASADLSFLNFYYYYLYSAPCRVASIHYDIFDSVFLNQGRCFEIIIAHHICMKQREILEMCHSVTE